MIQVVCNICRKVLKGNPQLHYCDRCIPFAQRYEEAMAQVNAELWLTVERRQEQARNDYLQKVVVPASKQTLKAV
jgi:hypothetical protein